MKENTIVLKAKLIIRSHNKMLVARFHDSVKGHDFYTLMGGSVNFGETADQALQREMHEELQCGVENAELLQVVENLFTHEGKSGHEIMFIYKGDLSNKRVYEQDRIHVVEETYAFNAEWIEIDAVLSGEIPLYPDNVDYRKLLAK